MFSFCEKKLWADFPRIVMFLKNRCKMLHGFFIIASIIGSVYGYPATWVQKITRNADFNDDDNSLVKYNEEFSDLDVYFKQNSTNTTKTETYTKKVIPFSTEFSDRNATNNSKNSTSQLPFPSPATNNIDPISQTDKSKKNDTRIPRGEEDSLEFSEQNASQEEDESSEEEEGGNMITGLLSAFLSGLSRPDGSIDLEAITGLLGSLSTQNPDGSYDFNGLTELLRGFLGGGDGGGSDIGAFTGGLLGAVIKGVANPPGPKGAGILTGKVVTGILPALSGPAPSDDMMPGKKAPPLDSGAFLTGFLKTALGSGGNGTMGGGQQSKYTLFKLIFSAITGVFSAASSLSSKSDWDP